MTQTPAKLTADQWDAVQQLLKLLGLSPAAFAASYGIECGRDFPADQLPDALVRMFNSPPAEWKK